MDFMRSNHSLGGIAQMNNQLLCKLKWVIAYPERNSVRAEHAEQRVFVLPVYARPYAVV